MQTAQNRGCPENVQKAKTVKMQRNLTFAMAQNLHSRALSALAGYRYYVDRRVVLTISQKRVLGMSQEHFKAPWGISRDQADLSRWNIHMRSLDSHREKSLVLRHGLKFGLDNG